MEDEICRSYILFGSLIQTHIKLLNLNLTLMELRYLKKKKAF